MIRAFGIDLSHNQKYYTYQEHQNFVIHKASEGMNPNKEDSFGLDRHYEECRKAKIFGAYHYFRSGTTYPYKGQVEAYLMAIEGKEVDFHVVDFEKTGNTPSMRFGNDCKAYIEHLKSIRDEPVLFYSNRAVIQEWMFQYGVHWVRDYPDLWIAQYPYRGWNERMREVPDTKYGWYPALPAETHMWRFWQYSADGNKRGPEEGVTDDWWRPIPSVDLDVFNGTFNDLLDWCNKSPLPPKPPHKHEFVVESEQSGDTLTQTITVKNIE
jgi:GH25 family lysozyme M1 (1,4-beta-N-acetylmuramidase)